MEFFMTPYGMITLSVLAVLTAGYLGAPLWIWSLLGFAALFVFKTPIHFIYAFGALALVFNIKPIRKAFVSSAVMWLLKKLGFLPQISATERTALEAGAVWVEADLFSGRPNFKKILKEDYPELSAEERAFLDGPVEKLCSMVTDWDVWKHRRIPREAWDYLRKERFLGMIIPKEFGGLGFSAHANSSVIQKLASRSVPVCITVMVPNSLGPAELLNHYGTDSQKKYYLPRLANGTEIPCFALTEPTAGSDAGSIQSSGVLFKGKDGKTYVRLNWNKRWISLAAISTVVGLAFKLKDPENLLGRGEDLGITCALIPSNTPGVVLGRRHDPLGVPFFNCPTQGKDVVVLADEAIIGGLAGAGLGWKMLMESLAAGRGISLPAQSAGGSKLIARVAGAHATVRKQFGLSIGKFEGVEEPLARITGFAYLMEAFRKFVTAGIDKGMKPAVVTAMAKYHQTELMRKAINDGMDILGGAGITMGPRNLLGTAYITMPIAITVEGANILTRTLMIFGQGALRCHPYAFKEVNAVEKNDLKAFDDAFWGHIGHVVRNLFRSVMLSLTRGRLTASPVGGPSAKYFRKLAWVSASFAIMADLAMATLGGALKQKEKITGRFADIFSWMFIATSVLRRFEAEGRKKEDIPLLDYSMHHAFNEMQIAFDGIFANMKVPGLTWFFKHVLGAWSKTNTLMGHMPDYLGHKVAAIALTPGDQRDRLTYGIYIPKDIKDGLGRLEHAFAIVKRAEAAEKKIRQAVRAKKLPKKKAHMLHDEALAAGIINQDEFKDLRESEEVRNDAIQVDDFSSEEYMRSGDPGEIPEASVHDALSHKVSSGF